MRNGVDKIRGSDVLVVGGGGFIGQHIINALLSLDCGVTGLSRGSSAGLAAKGYRQLCCDLRDREAVKTALRGGSFDYVFNAGGYIDHTPYFRGGRDVMEQHFSGTLNLTDCLDRTGLKGYVHIGSSDEYGDAPAPQHEDMRERPISPYSAAKVAAAHFVQMLARTEDFPGAVVRLYLVYGPGQDARRFLPHIISSCLKGKEFEVSEGRQLRDFCYVDDVVEGLLLAAVRASRDVINVASGSPVTIRSMIERVRTLTGKGTPLFGRVPYRAGENMQLYADITRAKELLGWEPRVSIEDGLNRTIEWFRKEENVPVA